MARRGPGTEHDHVTCPDVRWHADGRMMPLHEYPPTIYDSVFRVQMTVAQGNIG